MLQKVPITENKTLHRNRSTGSHFFTQKNGYITLGDGMSFAGMMPAWQTGPYAGEAVFTTGMTGYVEALTDPSYAGQILVFTYPLVGNYGVRVGAGESDKIQVSGIVVSEATTHWSHQQSDRSLLEWLAAQGIPIVTDVDTRALTKHLRTKGTMAGAITATPGRIELNIKLATPFVTIKRPLTYNRDGVKKVIVVDCGAKENIIRSLVKLGLQVRRVPFDYDYTGENYDGVLLSNGPGNPTDYLETIAVARTALRGDKPVFGICLGSQIMGLAAGAKTYKLIFGHRGHNQPCQDTASRRAYVTSQNHGYAIDETSLPEDWRVNFRNLNDNSVEGVEHTIKPFFSVQFHPEACPGPTDTEWLFERFYKTL